MDRRYSRFVSKNLSCVLMSVNADIPRDIDVFVVEEHDERRSEHAGLAKLGEVGVAAAITNVIYHATVKHIRKLPEHVADQIRQREGPLSPVTASRDSTRYNAAQVICPISAPRRTRCHPTIAQRLQILVEGN